MLKKLLASFVAVLAFAGAATAQKSIRDSSINVFLLGVYGGADMPQGDFADRFGLSARIGPSFLYKHTRQWVLGFEPTYIFGNQVKENPLASIQTPDGYLINSAGQFQVLEYYQRGYHLNFRVGRLSPVIGPNPNSGLLFMAGVGFLQHKIRYYWPANLPPPQLDNGYDKGYDRLTNGLSLSQTLMFLYLDSWRLKNFAIGVEVTEAFTQNRRSWNWDERRADNSTRLDILIGLRANWYFPLYRRSADSDYF